MEDLNGLEYVEVIDLELAELTQVLVEKRRHFANADVEAYAQMKFNFLTGNKINLESLDLQVSPERTALYKKILVVQHQLIDRNVAHQDIENLLGSIPPGATFQGDLYFLAGLCYWNLSDIPRSLELFEMSYRSLDKHGSQRKILTALNNKISCQISLHPERSFVQEYTYLLNKAPTELKGIIYKNLASEYTRVDALELALQYAEKSLTELKKSPGRIEHFTAHLIKAYVHVKRGEPDRARESYEVCMLAPFDEVISVRKFIRALLDNDPTAVPPASEMPPVWRERVEAHFRTTTMASGGLSKTQKLLISLLLDKPRHRYEIIEELYGNEVPIESSENRLKNVLNRIRKKYPDLIRCKESIYSVTNSRQADTLVTHSN